MPEKFVPFSQDETLSSLGGEKFFPFAGEKISRPEIFLDENSEDEENESDGDKENAEEGEEGDENGEDGGGENGEEGGENGEGIEDEEEEEEETREILPKKRSSAVIVAPQIFRRTTALLTSPLSTLREREREKEKEKGEKEREKEKEKEKEKMENEKEKEDEGLVAYLNPRELPPQEPILEWRKEEEQGGETEDQSAAQNGEKNLSSPFNLPEKIVSEAYRRINFRDIAAFFGTPEEIYVQEILVSVFDSPAHIWEYLLSREEREIHSGIKIVGTLHNQKPLMYFLLNPEAKQGWKMLIGQGMTENIVVR